MKTIGFNSIEEQKLLEILRKDNSIEANEFIRRIDSATSLYVNTSNNNGFNFYCDGNLPVKYSCPIMFNNGNSISGLHNIEKSYIGKQIRIINGKDLGRIGIITAHWVNGDDCSGGFQQELCSLDNENHYNNSMAYRIDDCELI